jgi:hypothetical protein
LSLQSVLATVSEFFDFTAATMAILFLASLVAIFVYEYEFKRHERA